MTFTDLFIAGRCSPSSSTWSSCSPGCRRSARSRCASSRASDVAIVRVTTVYIGASADLVRGFITTRFERVIAGADGIDYLESSSAQGVSTITVHLQLNYDTNAALTQIQAKVAQVRNELPPEAEAPIIELETADNQFAAMYLGFLVERHQPEPDHRLPQPAWCNRGCRRSPACSAPRSSATAPSRCGSGSSRQAGSARDLRFRGPGGASRRTTSCRRSPDQ